MMRNALLLVGILSFPSGAFAMNPADVPADAPNDAIMVSPAEVAELADWAVAAFTGSPPAGREDEKKNATLFLAATPPFSFVYGGAPSAQLLKGWTRDVARLAEAGTHSAPAGRTTSGPSLRGGLVAAPAGRPTSKDRVEYTVTWTDPKTQLRVTAVVGVFKRYPAVDWVLYFENQGKEDTPILENVQALDTELRTGDAKKPAVLHQLAGDSCSERSFVPFDTTLEPGRPYRVAPGGGRPSNGAFPFWTFEYGGQGIIGAIGWSGQWAASFDRTAAGPTRVRAGMELTHLKLHPGERIRSPRILLLHWKGDRMAAQNRFRRLLFFHYVPQQNGKPAAMPIFWQNFDRYNGRPGWATEAGQLDALKAAHESGCDTLWLDAAWFPKGFPNGVGTWSCDPQRFPNGLKPVSDAAHKLGLGFILWFEPERVAQGTEIAREHPEFVFGGEKGGLFKLNDPAARRWLTDRLAKCVEEFGLDWYRNDFNIDPLGFWRANDPPDRQGITEIRYVEGHYEMWDELVRRKPGLLIDNCASGGRRIDLETIMRSVPLWQSDTSCSAGHPEWNQTQNYGLTHYLPFHDCCTWTPGAYDFRSGATAGAIVQFAYLDPGYSAEAAKAAVAEARDNQKYWYGDFYPLTPCSTSLDSIIAWQFHRPDLNAGLILAFRRPQSPYVGLGVALHGLNPDAAYTLEMIDEARKVTTRTATGKELMSEHELRLGPRGSSLVVRYKAK